MSTTTIHLPEDLLQSVSRRAEELGLSRNRFIRQALEKALAEDEVWSPEFLRALDEAAGDADSHLTVDEMLEAIVLDRTSKGPPPLGTGR